MLSGAVAYLNPEMDDWTYEFTLIEVYGAGHLVFPRQGTVVKVDAIYGDDTGYIHVPPRNTLNITGMAEYKRINVTWAPYVYQDATLVLPNGTFEIRQAENLSYPAALARSSQVSFWGQVVGNKAHFMVGYGATVTFESSAPRNLQFAGISIQKTGRLELISSRNNESDIWDVKVTKVMAPVYRDGSVTVEGGGIFVVRNLRLNAERLTVDPVGTLTANGKGFTSGISKSVTHQYFVLMTVRYLN